MEKLLQGDKISLGVCYYPEHWDKKLWTDDLMRMKKHGITVIRIAEFAWSIFERTEGEWSFDFFDDFLNYAINNDMSVIFCTPTATPPAWLTNKYPEVLNADINGNLINHGDRRHYNYNSTVYLEFTRKIVEKLGEHYGKHPAIIGWQIDNEINCEASEFYSESDSKAFRIFLEEKYKKLDVLNEAWGTVFWNQCYTSWEEVFVPRKTNRNAHNPHMLLDYIRFISESACSYVKLQSDILRKYIKKDVFITTNGIFVNLDNHRMVNESLDFITYDSYPAFAYCLTENQQNSNILKDREWSRNLTEIRSISPSFGIMEQQSGSPGWTKMFESPQPKPGQMTLWTMQSIAHGAEFVSYFRWRTSAIGTEIYWHGILDYSNRDNRRLAELGDISAKTKVLKEFAGSVYEAAFAVIKDYDNVWDASYDVWHRRLENASEAGIFQASQISHTPMDYIYIDDSTVAKKLQNYPVLFYPHPVIMTKERTELLENYVSAGGVLVLGCRSGYKDKNGKCPMEKLPGLLRNLTQADVTDFTFIHPTEEMIVADWEGTEITVPVFNDIIEPLEDAKPLAFYKNNYYAGKAALVYRKYGQGKVFYFGGTFSCDVMKVFFRKLGIENPNKDLIEVPECCEIVLRKKEGKRYIFILNYSKDAVIINIKKEMKCLFSGEKVFGDFKIPGYGTAIYCLKL